MFDSNNSSESTSPIDLPRRTLRSLSMMICIPPNFVPNLRPKQNTMHMSPLKLRDLNPEEEGYNSDENKEKMNSKLKRRKQALYTVFASSQSSKKELVDDLFSTPVSKLCEQYPIIRREKKKNKSILTLLQKRK